MAATCGTGYAKASTTGTCILCTTPTLPATVTLGISEITACTVDAAGTSFVTITACGAGYAPFALSGGTLKGCLSC